MSCAAFTFLGIYAAAANKPNEWIVRGSIILGICFFAVAAYGVWRDEYRKGQDAAIEYETSLAGIRRDYDLACAQRETATTALKDLTAEFQTERNILNREIGRPEISLRFAEPDAREPVWEGSTRISYGPESEFVARNGSDRDAFGVFITPYQIGKFTIQSRRFADLPRNTEARIDYIVYETDTDGQSCISGDYRHHLRPLLDVVFDETRCNESSRFLAINLQLIYKDSTGRRFSSAFTLSHHPLMDGYPRIFVGPEQN